MDYKIYSSTYNILNHGVGGITDEMTSYKHVFVSAVVHFYSFSTVHIRPEKTSEYDQEIPQSHTADQDQA